MSNIISDLTARIEDYRSTNKKPCKNYASQSRAEKATAAVAETIGYQLDKEGKSARYVVFYIEAWGRWVGAIDMTEMVKRHSFIGGYVGGDDGFFNY